MALTQQQVKQDPQWKVDQFNYDFELQYDDEEDEYYGFALASTKVPIGLPSRLQLLMNPNILIADTGSTDNTTGSILGAFNVRKYKGPSTKTATNKDMNIRNVFDFKATITDRYGYEKETALFKGFKYIPTAQYTLVAINKYLLNGWKLEGDNSMGLRLKKGNMAFTFDLPIYTTDGVLFVMHAKRRHPQTDSTEHEMACFSCKYTYYQVHKLLGHTNEIYTRDTAEHLGWNVKGKWRKNCEACGIGRARQKNLGTGTDNPKRNRRYVVHRWY